LGNAFTVGETANIFYGVLPSSMEAPIFFCDAVPSTMETPIFLQHASIADATVKKIKSLFPDSGNLQNISWQAFQTLETANFFLWQAFQTLETSKILCGTLSRLWKLLIFFVAGFPDPGNLQNTLWQAFQTLETSKNNLCSSLAKILQAPKTSSRSPKDRFCLLASGICLLLRY
jgi:hypothetical protein